MPDSLGNKFVYNPDFNPSTAVVVSYMAVYIRLSIPITYGQRIPFIDRVVGTAMIYNSLIDQHKAKSRPFCHEISMVWYGLNGMCWHLATPPTDVNYI